jgi:hypothetical protein
VAGSAKIEKGRSNPTFFLQKGLTMSEDNAELEFEQSGYCPSCGACGENPCCHISQCKKLTCFYGEGYAALYDVREKEAREWYYMLAALGIRNPYMITLGNVRAIGDILIEGINKTIKELVHEQYKILKEKERDEEDDIRAIEDEIRKEETST